MTTRKYILIENQLQKRMKTKINWKMRNVIILIVLLKFNTNSLGQIQVTKEKQKVIVDKLANEIIARYLNSQTANLLADSLNKFGNNATKSIESPSPSSSS